MTSQPHWKPDAAPRRRIAQIVAYTKSPYRPIAHAVPVIGGLDAALRVEMAWPALQESFRDYRDFRRVRSTEAALCGVHPHVLHFGRREWQQVCEVLDVAAARQRRQVCAGSYLPVAPPLLRIHG